jgi:hemerythrin-like metal-binding protein
VDQQHRKLVELINLLAGQVASGGEAGLLGGVVDELADYAVYHFKTEEVIWHTYFAFDQAEQEHLAMHAAFRQELSRIETALQSAASLHQVAEEALDFLARWLASHILEADRCMAYAVHAMQQGLPREVAKARAREQMAGSTRMLIDIMLSIYSSLSTNTLQLMRELAERRQSEATLREYARQMEHLSRFALEAQETERRRLAIELHDELGQALTAVKINLQAHGRFSRQPPDEINAENISIVDNALQLVRRLALALRPSMLDDLGLVPALRWLAEQTEARASLVVAVHASNLKPRLTPELETACFRIVQEALTNVVRHADAHKVEIQLSQDADTLQLSVEDDGCGFDPAVECKRALAGGSMGVLGMQERAVLIGGRLDVLSTPGHGSRVSLRCPLRMRGDVT